MSNKQFLVDTNIIIDFLRGNQTAKEFIIENVDQIKISVVTVSELYAGVKGKKEEAQLDGFLSLFETINLESEVAVQAGYLKNKYFKSHSSGLAGGMIAATALDQDLKLVRGKLKHFPMVSDKTKL